jgi:hypothetical protein
VIERWAGSGLSVRAFCRQEGLGESNFHRWRRVIARRDAEADRSTGQNRSAKPHAGQNGEAKRAKPATGRSSRAKRPKQTPAFVPVVVPDEPQREPDIVIELAGGRRLRLPEATPVERLVGLVHALEADASEKGDSPVDTLQAEAAR